VPGTPLGLQRVLSDQLNGRLPLVVVYVTASAAGAPAKRMAKSTTARVARLTPIETASRLGRLRRLLRRFPRARPSESPPGDIASVKTPEVSHLRACGTAYDIVVVI